MSDVAAGHSNALGQGPLLMSPDPEAARAAFRNKPKLLTDKVMSVSEAVQRIVCAGDYLASGGFGGDRIATALLHEIVRRQIQGLGFAGHTATHDFQILCAGNETGRGQLLNRCDVAYIVGLEVRGLSRHTKESYVGFVTRLSRHYRRAPDKLSDDLYASPRTLNNYFNRAAFARPVAGALGNLTRNAVVGPVYWNIDLGISRLITLGTRRVELRMEAFNVLNHFNWGVPLVNFNSGQFGRITTQAGAPRVMQFGVKYDF